MELSEQTEVTCYVSCLCCFLGKDLDFFLTEKLKKKIKKIWDEDTGYVTKILKINKIEFVKFIQQDHNGSVCFKVNVLVERLFLQVGDRFFCDLKFQVNLAISSCESMIVYVELENFEINKKQEKKLVEVIQVEHDKVQNLIFVVGKIVEEL
jgi:hypothetical protein